MLSRIITAIFGISSAFVIVYVDIFNNILFFIAVLIISLMISIEISQMAIKRNFKNHIYANSIATTLSIINFYIYSFNRSFYNIYTFFYVLILITTLLLVITSVRESFAKSFENSFENIALPVYSYILTGLLFPFTILIHRLYPSGWLITVFIAIVWMTDAGGYFFGKLFGKNKIKDLSSPSKTVEGYIGAVITGIVSGIILYFLQFAIKIQPQLSFIQLLILSIILSILAIFGDIIESTLKRWAGVKDSGVFFPGHGGFYDRFDSMIYGLPVYYVFLKLWGY